LSGGDNPLGVRVPNTQAQFGFKHIDHLGGDGAPDYQRNGTLLLSEIARLLGRAAARQWLSDGTADDEPAAQSKSGT
jgi:hypothetical protein